MDKTLNRRRLTSYLRYSRVVV